MQLIEKTRESKKSKVVSITLKNKEARNGWYNFDVKFENGDVGQVGSKTPTDDYFVEGREVDYILSKCAWDDGSGTLDKVLRPGGSGFKGGGGAKWQPKGPKEYKSEMVGMCLKYAYDAVALFNQEEKRDVKAIKPYFDAFIKMAFDKIDEIHKEV